MGLREEKDKGILFFNVWDWNNKCSEGYHLDSSPEGRGRMWKNHD